MNAAQIKHIVQQYTKATACQTIEVGPAHLTVKLSPEADKQLMNRPYYWGFIERTGEVPETMTITFVFDHEAIAAGAYNSGRVEYVGYGSSMLQQIIQAIKARGQFVHLYEEPPQASAMHGDAIAYTSWLIVNYKIAFLCDMKRDELHSLGISLATGDIVENGHAHVMNKALTPKLPAHTHLRETISLQRAQSELVHYLTRKLEAYDAEWAAAAYDRMHTETETIRTYYNDLLLQVDEESKADIEQQYRNRLTEIEWQFKPRIEINPVNGGLFHLLGDGIPVASNV